MKKKMPRPTQGDMELLTLLWENGSLSISETHDKYPRKVGYTTVQTQLNRLVDKGLAKKNKAIKKPARYSAILKPEDVSATQLDSLVDRVTHGSVVPLVAHLVNRTSLTNDELTEIKSLLKEAERRLKKGAK